MPAADSTGADLLHADISVQRGTFVLRAEFAVARGEILAVLGPNGSGKSTLLSVLAGLLSPDTGSVVLDGRRLSSPGDVVPPHRRRVGLMGQDPMLFPHLTAAENIAFGPRSQGTPHRAALAAARGWLDRMGLAGMGDRRPDGLSGGQRQRVALARALAAEPDLLLLDEPFGALDAETVPEVRNLVRVHLAEVAAPTLLVTHDVLDAAVLADRAMVLEGGAVADHGPVAEVLSAPKTPFTATLAGLNLVTGTLTRSVAAGQPGSVTAGGVDLTGIAAEAMAAGDAAAAVFGPSAVAVYPDGAAGVGGSPRNTLPGTVTDLEPGPGAARLRVRCGDGVMVAADVTPAAVAELALMPGTAVRLAVKATEVRLHRR